MYNKENKEELSTSRTQRKYGHEYKVQAVKLAREIGGAKENEFLEEASAFFAASHRKSARTKE